MLSVLKENRKWNQGESVWGQIFNSYRVTSCFPSEKVKILLCNCYAEWSMSAGLLKLFSKVGHKCKACSQQLTAPSFLRNKANICNEEWIVSGVFKPTTLTSRIIRFQRQKKKKKSRWYSLHGSGDEKPSCNLGFIHKKASERFSHE